MMLSLFTRRVTLSAHRSTATYTRILSCPVSTLRAKTTSGTKPHTGTIRTFANPQRNASTKASAATKKTESSTTTGRTKPKRGLTPEQKAVREQTLRAKKELEKKKKAERAAALRAKRKAQEVKKKEAAVQKRKQLVEKRKKLAEAKKAKEKERKQKEKEKVQKEKEKREEQKKAREAKKPMFINPPPRRMSPFSVFLQETRKPIREVAADWRNLSEEGKQEYAARAKAVAGKRKEEFDVFIKTVTPLDVLRYNRHRKAAGATRIKVKFNNSSTNHSISSFLRYIKEFRRRPDQAGKLQVEIAKAAGEAWRSMTKEEKDQYRNEPESTTAQEGTKSP